MNVPRFQLSKSCLICTFQMAVSFVLLVLKNQGILNSLNLYTVKNQRACAR